MCKRNASLLMDWPDLGLLWLSCKKGGPSEDLEKGRLWTGWKHPRWVCHVSSGSDLWDGSDF